MVNSAHSFRGFGPAQQEYHGRRGWQSRRAAYFIVAKKQSREIVPERKKV